MGWVKVGYGVWGDSAQDLAEEFLEEFLGLREENEQETLFWIELAHYLGASTQGLETFDVSEDFPKVSSLNPLLVSATERFLWSFVRVYGVNVGRSPSWEELVNTVAASAGKFGILEIPNYLGQIGLVEALELEEVGYVCSKPAPPDEMVATNLKERIFVHGACLAPIRTETIELELPVETVMFLVDWSNKVNMPINLLFTRILIQELQKRDCQ